MYVPYTTKRKKYFIYKGQLTHTIHNKYMIGRGGKTLKKNTKMCIFILDQLSGQVCSSVKKKKEGNK